MDKDEIVEVMNQALNKAWQLGQTYWQQADSEYTSHHKKADVTQAKFQQLVAETCAAIERMEAAPAVPDGWQLVPKEPTNGMIRASDPVNGSEYTSARSIYRAMLAAAPQPAACEWRCDDDVNMPNTWDGACGAKWSFIEGGPEENGMRFCPECGKTVQILAPQPAEKELVMMSKAEKDRWDELEKEFNKPSYDELRTENQRLREELAAMTKERDTLRSMVTSDMELGAACQKDAERYRMHVKLWSARHGVPEDEVVAELDAAIAAHKEEK